MTNQEWHGPNRLAAGLPAVAALVLTASFTGWRDLRIAMVAFPAAALVVTLIAAVTWARSPGTPRARYWQEFTRQTPEPLRTLRTRKPMTARKTRKTRKACGARA